MRPMRAGLASTTTNFPSSSADTRRAMAAAVPTTVEPLMTYARLALIVSLSALKTALDDHGFSWRSGLDGDGGFRGRRRIDGAGQRACRQRRCGDLGRHAIGADRAGSVGWDRHIRRDRLPRPREPHGHLANQRDPRSSCSGFRCIRSGRAPWRRITGRRRPGSLGVDPCGARVDWALVQCPGPRRVGRGSVARCHRIDALFQRFT